MRDGVDVYLLPAVVGGGLGDIDEVLVAGNRLARVGFPITLYRRPGRLLPRSVDGPWDWPRIERRAELRPRARAALTVSAAWGVSAAPERDEPFGRAGPWADEATEIERTYGPASTLHVSLEEFARTWTSHRESLERWREGGRSMEEIRRRARTAEFAQEVAAYHRAYARFRAFDRLNVLHLFATFRPSPAFAREYPAAVLCGPLWPTHHRRPARPPRRSQRGRRWVWYASPSSSERLVPALLRGLRGSSLRLTIRSSRALPIQLPRGGGPVELQLEPLPPARWRREFDRAELRIVTGSRTLLEALHHGGPFLYFNGVTGPGRRARRHRPEKIARLLQAWRLGGSDEPLARDLADFARGRRIEEIARHAAAGRGGWSRFPKRPVAAAFPPPFTDAGTLIERVAIEFSHAPREAREIVARVRRRQLAP